MLGDNKWSYATLLLYDVVNNQNIASKIPKMNDNVGEQVAWRSNLGSSQINKAVLSINDMGTKKI